MMKACLSYEYIFARILHIMFGLAARILARNNLIRLTRASISSHSSGDGVGNCVKSQCIYEVHFSGYMRIIHVTVGVHAEASCLKINRICQPLFYVIPNTSRQISATARVCKYVWKEIGALQ